jgi:hypothetical protein
MLASFANHKTVTKPTVYQALAMAPFGPGLRVCTRAPKLKRGHHFSRERPAAISVLPKTDVACQRCISPACGATYAIDEVRVACRCGHLLDVRYEWDRLRLPKSLDYFEQKWSRRYDPLCASGVWRFHEL